MLQTSCFRSCTTWCCNKEDWKSSCTSQMGWTLSKVRKQQQICTRQLSVRLSICLSVSPSVRPSFRLPACLSFFLSLCLFNQLWIWWSGCTIIYHIFATMGYLSRIIPRFMFFWIIYFATFFMNWSVIFCNSMCWPLFRLSLYRLCAHITMLYAWSWNVDWGAYNRLEWTLKFVSYSHAARCFAALMMIFLHTILCKHIPIRAVKWWVVS